MNQLARKIKSSLRAYPNSLIFENEVCYTFRDLEAKKNQLHGYIETNQHLFAGPVVLALNKSLDALAMQLALLEKGIIYIPIDKDSHDSRINYIVELSQSSAIISNVASRDSIAINDLLHLSFNSNVTPNYPRQCAAVMFTSGSTGVPKGIMISSKSLDVFTNWAIEQFEIDSNEVLTSIAPFHFDLSTFDIYVAMKTGASLWLIDNDHVSNPRWFKKQSAVIQPTIIYATPSWLKMTFQFNGFDREHGPKKVLYAGEEFDIPSLNKLIALWPDADYFNLYGPTETNVCTFYRVPKHSSREQPHPIGKPCPYADLSIDSESNELIVTGESLMLGYLGEKSPIQSFNTSDRMTKDENGNLIFQGRTDRMIKRNGFRIEPAEIEHILMSHKGINDCITIWDNDKITAVYTGEKQSIVDLKSFCKSCMLSYLIPDNFMYLETLPLGTSQKVDLQEIKRIIAHGI